MGEVDNELKNIERVWMTRTTCLETAGKNFQKSVMPVLEALKAREGSKAKGGHATQNGPLSKADPNRPDPKSRSAQTAQYDRYVFTFII